MSKISEFKNFYTRKDESVANFIENKLISGNKLYVGTDSIVRGKFINYIIIVATYDPILRKGGSCIYTKKTEQRTDIYNRLYAEGLLTIQLANDIVEIFSVEPKTIVVEFDYNNYRITKSSKLINVFDGWCKSLNFEPAFKSDEQIAVKAANYLCQIL